jgi:hypothetical protein
LSTLDTFEVTCRYEGVSPGFKVRGRIDGDVVYAVYLTDDGDRASLSLFREAIASSPTPASPPPSASGSAQFPNVPAPPQPRTANLQLPTCANFRVLMNYTRHSFENRDDPILGVPPAEWSASTLASVRRWADGCLARGLASDQIQSFQSLWQHFQTEAAAGITMLADKAAQAAIQQQELAQIRAKMAEAILLSKGGAVSCALLGTTAVTSDDLNKPVFGQKLREYAEADFRTLREKLAQCDAYVSEQRGKYKITYAPHRETIQNLESWISKWLDEEADAAEKQRLARELQDPEKRAQYEAREKERRFATQEAQLRGALEGQSVRQPDDAPSEQIVYCGAYFSVFRAIDALVRADITPSADDSTLRALGFQTLGQTWLANRRGVLGAAAVERELRPVFNAGLTAGLAADLDTTKRLYRTCTSAAEALTREREKLR